jgi:hypothetical protein
MIAYWQLDGNSAALISPAVSVKIELTQPDQGLVLTPPEPERSTRALHILGVMVAEQVPVPSQRIDPYTRGADLVATYGEVPEHRLRSQVYWRCVTAKEFGDSFASSVVAAFDLILSSNTSLLDSDPRLNVRSQVPGIVEALQFRCSSTGANDWHARQILPPQSIGNSAQPIAVAPEEGAAGCFLTRLGRLPFSYLEMVHPADFCGSTITFTNPSQAGEQDVLVEHQLFHQRLEKGVILRARVRSAIIARQQDEETALAAYQKFAAAEPPLTV